MTLWTLDPWTYLEGTALEDHYDPASAGLFHVTTAAAVIERERVLRSRAQLDQAGTRHRGLGGGKNRAVSFAFDLDRSRKLFRAMRAVRRAMMGQMTVPDLLGEVFAWTGFPNDWDWDWDDEEQQAGVNRELLAVLDLEEIEPAEIQTLSDWQAVWKENETRLARAFSSPRDAYRLVQEIEGAMLSPVEQMWRSDDLVACTPLIGFVSTFEDFERIDVDQISIAQCEARVGAEPYDYVPDECELQFLPEDVRVVQTRVEERGPVVIAQRED
jgi:hypothetical protein